MIGQLNMSGLDKVETAIKRLQTFEPLEDLTEAHRAKGVWKTVGLKKRRNEK